jgi:hypothetical protein
MYNEFIWLEADFIQLSKGAYETEWQYLQTLVKSCHNYLYRDSYGILYLLHPRYIGKNMKDIDFKHQLEEEIFSWYGDDPANLINELKHKMALQYTNFVA